ncbi:ParB/RepB/Spo0J family partition protein [soil metagenome]
MKKTGLGKGFDSLLPTNFDSSILLEKGDRIQKLLISVVEPNKDQPRKHFDESALDELASSIKQYGVLQPLIVIPANMEGKYLIVAGERRWRAAGKAGLKQVPCIIREREQLEQLEISLIENVQRVDLSPLEQAISIEKLHQEFNMAYSDIAKRLGKAPTTINNVVRLLQLPEEARLALEGSKISEGHARAILSLKGNELQQKTLLANIIEHTWSVRQAEQFVVALKQGKKDDSAQRRTSIESKETKQLSDKLNTKVTVRHTARGGRLELHFSSEKEMQTLIKKLL